MWLKSRFIHKTYKFERRKNMKEEENNVPEIEEELDDVVILNDEEGKEVKFEFLDVIELDTEEYVDLLPIEE